MKLKLKDNSVPVKNGTVLIGRCAVDSGQIMLVDPCYLDNYVNDEFVPENMDQESDAFSYSNACKVTLTEPNKGGQLGLAVVTSSGMGDGYYPVYAEMVDGLVSSVTIEFMETTDNSAEFCHECGEWPQHCECDGE